MKSGSRSLGLIVLLLLAGCATSSKRPPIFSANEPIAVTYQDQAARGGLAVVSVAAWEDYAATLQPVFALTPEQALAQAVPTTSRQTSSLLDALAVGLKLALPTTARTSTTTRQTTGGETTVDRTSTSTSQPGDVSAIELPEPASAAAPRTSATSPLDQPIEAGGLASYAAATALFQEVQLINTYVRHAALAANKEAFVVRIQVSLLPQVRGQAYDAYTTLSFMADAREANNAGAAPPVSQVAVPYGGSAETRRDSPAPGEPTPKDLWAKVTVLPILVTDSLEQSNAELAASRNREFTLGLAALVSGLGASADVSRSLQQLQTAIGTDYNAIRTVTKVADNSLRVRFGAELQIGNGLAMVPRNHTVTAVLLVEKSKDAKVDAVTVLSKTQVVDATKGVVLPSRPASDVEQWVTEAVAPLLPRKEPATSPGKKRKPSPVEIAAAKDKAEAEAARKKRLAYAAMSNDRKEFNAVAGELGIEAAAYSRLWLDLVDIGSMNAYALTTFELPPVTRRVPNVGTQDVTVFDNGKTASVRVRGTTGFDPHQLSAFLNVGFPAIVLPGSIVPAGPGAIQITFASPQKLKLCASSACVVKLDLIRTLPDSRWRPEEGGKQEVLSRLIYTNYTQIPAPDPEPSPVKFSMSVGAAQILRTPSGSGTVSLLFQRGEDRKDAAEEMFFGVTGADVVSATPGKSITFTGKGWRVNAAPGQHVAITLSLANLVDGTDVTITPRNPDGAGTPKVLRVSTVPAKQEK